MLTKLNSRLNYSVLYWKKLYIDWALFNMQTISTILQKSHAIYIIFMQLVASVSLVQDI